MQDPYLAETVLALEQADCIGMARTLLADPDWPVKVQEGREKELRRCVGCNQGCLAAAWFGKPVSCLVNSEAGKEYLHREKKETSQKKKVLVIGAGPAGLEFAIKAHDEGHEVTIWEKENEIGGQLHMVAAPVGKEDFKDLCGYYQASLKKRGIQVVFGKTADVENVKNSGADVVVVATGASAKEIPVENPGGIPVESAWDVLAKKVVVGRNVIVIGGGAVGCETAQLLAHQGTLSPEQLYFLSVHKAVSAEWLERLLNHTQRNINIIECAPRLGSGFSQGCAWPVMKDLKRLGIGQYTNARIVNTTAKTVQVLYKNKEGAEMKVELPCDTIILAVGSKAENKLYEALLDAGCKVYRIGDCMKPGNILNATTQAGELAASI